MRINDTWAITGNAGDYIVTERRPGINPKTKEASTTLVRTFHPSIEQCATKIARTVGKHYVGLSDLECVLHALKQIEAAVREKVDAETKAV
jgi:hypothetical protein